MASMVTCLPCARSPIGGPDLSPVITPRETPRSALKSEREQGEKTVRTLLYTTLALMAIAILLIGLSRMGTGLSYLPATRMTGFGFIYNFASMHVFFVGAGVGVAALVLAIAAGCKSRSLAKLPDVDDPFSLVSERSER